MRNYITLFFFLLFAVGCTSSSVYQSGGGAGTVQGISAINVEMSEKMHPESREWYRQNAVSGALYQTIQKELQKNGKWGTGSQTLHVSVTDFRVRSGSQVFWVGVMAGSDYVAAEVEARQGDTTVKKFAAGAKSLHSATSGLLTGKLTSRRRVETLCKSVAKNLVEQL